MLRGLALLLGYQLTGEVLSRLLRLPVPGPVIGMLLLFSTLVLWRRTPPGLAVSANGLLKHLSLLYVPAGVGVVQYLGALRADGVAIAVAVAVSTALAMAVTAITLQWLLRQRRGAAR